MKETSRILPKIMDVIRENGIEIITVNIKNSLMDDVFVYYTGYDLRDGELEEKSGKSEIAKALE